ncbi:MAG: hypothetical protein KAT00_09660, partial [Planctomycetes bacterium]|nr:hypothetical protein [Planctomycetota bacterium]
SSSYGYAAVLSFDTVDLPDDVTIMAARIELTRGGASGTIDPFTWGGACYIDIIKPFFGTERALENVDWDADPNETAVATFAGPDPGPDTPMISSYFAAEALSHIDKTSTTQMRVRFTNLYNEPVVGFNYLGFYSGDNANTDYHPKLIITYAP